jgi:hypothetical protein
MLMYQKFLYVMKFQGHSLSAVILMYSRVKECGCGHETVAQQWTVPNTNSLHLVAQMRQSQIITEAMCKTTSTGRGHQLEVLQQIKSIAQAASRGSVPTSIRRTV